MSKKAMTLEDFEGICETQKLKTGEDLLDIQGQCCPGEPVKAHYAPGTGLVTLKCSKCKTDVVNILTASITAAIYYQCLQTVVVEVEKQYNNSTVDALPAHASVEIPMELYKKIKEAVGVK